MEAGLTLRDGSRGLCIPGREEMSQKRAGPCRRELAVLWAEGAVCRPVASGRQLLWPVRPLVAAVAVRMYFSFEKSWCLWLMITGA